MEKLNEYKVKYAIVDGLAVNFHGYQRFTKDIDILVSLKKAELKQLVKCLKSLDFKPIYPISLDELLDESKRNERIKHKNMTVFSVVSDKLPSLAIYLFSLLILMKNYKLI